jgi:P4 family phage/plasmid primase-like protien
MADTVRDFMNNFRVENDKNYSHVSQMQPFLGKFNIERKDNEQFWNWYCTNLYNNGDKFLNGISERYSTVMPILCDIDLDTDYEEGKDYSQRLYTYDQMYTIVKIYIDTLKYIAKETDDKYFTAFVLEKTKPYRKERIVKNGFHIHFPFLFMTSLDQEMHLMPRVIREVDQRRVFSELKEYSSDAIDKGILKKYWLLYGARKDSALEAYKLTYIFNHSGKQIKLSEVMKSHEIFDSDDNIINLEDKSNKELEYYLPRILSIHPMNRYTAMMKDNLEVIGKQKLIKVKEIKGTFDNMPIQEAVALAKRLTEMLSPKRASHYETWIEVGWILFCIGDGCYEMLEAWISFSRKTTRNNFNEAYIVDTWNQMHRGNYTIGSLRMFANEDNPELYKQFFDEEKTKHIEESLNGGHYDIAKQMYDMFSDKYVCASVEGDLWYEYADHRWIKDEKGIELQRKIRQYIIPVYKEAGKRMYDQMRADGDTDTHNEVKEFNLKISKKIDRINVIINSLNTHGFKTSIMKEAQELFYNKEFLDKLDQDPYLIGFTNGVLDLKTCTFRAGRPEDYISTNTGYDYKVYKMSDPEIDTILDFFDKLFPDPELKEYALDYCAKLLRGFNFEKNFLVFTGEGDNGKSVLIDLLTATLGAYMAKLPTSLVVGKRSQSGSATTEINLLKGAVRAAILQEPSAQDQFNDGIIKELTGNDGIYVRSMYKEAEKELKPMAKLILICNRLPRISPLEKTIWNRIRLLYFESKFPKDNSLVPKSIEEQIEKKIFPRDEGLTEKLKNLKQAFMWFLVERYKDIKATNFAIKKEPVKLTEATRRYQENNDVVLQYITEAIVPDFSPDNKGLGLTDIYNSFKEFFSNTYTTGKPMNKIELRDDLITKWGNPGRNSVWRNKRFRSLVDSEEDTNSTGETQNC